MIDAGAGNDFVDARTGDDYVKAGAGNDTVFGDAGNDALRGEAGDDLIDGGDVTVQSGLEFEVFIRTEPRTLAVYLLAPIRQAMRRTMREP